jgi:recombination protein RecR
MPEVTPSAAAPVVRLIQEFHKLPGVGPKSAQRLTYYLLRAPQEEAQALAQAILEVKEKIAFCTICENVTDTDPCLICADSQRDRSIICVVEEPLDILALERSRSYHGLYHVLHGVISPMDGVGPEDLKVEELLGRLKGGGVSATAMYLNRLLRPLGLRVTRLARGLPTGADLEYADDLTLARAIEGRQEVG